MTLAITGIEIGGTVMALISTYVIAQCRVANRICGVGGPGHPGGGTADGLAGAQPARNRSGRGGGRSWDAWRARGARRRSEPIGTGGRRCAARALILADRDFLPCLRVWRDRADCASGALPDRDRHDGGARGDGLERHAGVEHNRQTGAGSAGRSFRNPPDLRAQPSRRWIRILLPAVCAPSFDVDAVHTGVRPFMRRAHRPDADDTRRLGGTTPLWVALGTAGHARSSRQRGGANRGRGGVRSHRQLYGDFRIFHPRAADCGLPADWLRVIPRPRGRNGPSRRLLPESCEPGSAPGGFRNRHRLEAGRQDCGPSGP